ncbi:glycosyltransferase [Novosphingobium kaempferiae]|uniref:glycosyltransferase n=1 Tax=Novosphingobium kaempferiae TaxID=2896849 RepID=UPI001E5EE73B|nr:glycosyltransferase [Novosphingobium kaempferiae]
MSISPPHSLCPLSLRDAAGGNRPDAHAAGKSRIDDDSPAIRAGSQTKGHVLFVSRQRIVGKTNGSSAYLLDLATAARRAGFTPHLLQPSPNIMGRWPFMRLRPEMAAFETHAIRGVIRYRRWVVSRDPGVFIDAALAIACRIARRAGLRGVWSTDRPRPYSIAAAWQDKDRTYLQRAADHADIVIADYAFQAEAFMHFVNRPSAIVMHDLFHRRDAQPDVTDSVAKLGKDDEIALLAKADAVIAIQSSEAHFILDNVPGSSAILAPMAVNTVSDVQPGKNGRLLFVGSNTAPNVVGLEWFFRDVWPLVKAHSPSATLDIAGTVNAGFAETAPAGVGFLGLVDDLTSLYTDAAIVISPLTFGSGLKIKLVEAMANGKAVVATGVTLQGVEAECDGAVIRADTGVQFAEAIVTLLDDDHRRIALARAALCAAKTHFSAPACHAEFIAWLESSRPTCSIEPGITE